MGYEVSPKNDLLNFLSMVRVKHLPLFWNKEFFENVTQEQIEEMKKKERGH